MDYSQKIMKSALLADAKKQSVAALALLAGANMDTALYKQDSPCTTLIRFCLFVPRAKLAKSKFRIVCQK